VSVSPARKIAFDLLRKVEAEDAYASDALHVALSPQIRPPVSSADAALATELTLGVLRWRAQLDFLLERHLNRPVARLDLPVALALRLGIYQLRFLRRIPAHAAVHESVELVKRAKKTSAAPLVNAVLRKAVIESTKPADSLLPVDLSPSERLALLYSHPHWLVDRWLSRFGESRSIALLKANNEVPALACSLNDPSQRDTLLAALTGNRFEIAPGALLRDAFRVRGGSPSQTKAFAEGCISIQDEASQAIPLLLDTGADDSVLDVCAAPGGKTGPLARAAGPLGLVIAADLHPHRLLAMRAQMRRLGLGRVHLVALDAEKPLAFAASVRFDRILVDAPCCGTGTLARHPEIRWRLAPDNLRQLHRLQTAILLNALAHLKPGGRLVYSTCSMEPEENEEVVAEILGQPGTRPHHAVRITRVPRGHALRAVAPHLALGINADALFDGDGQFHTYPDRDGTDGFFAALLEAHHT
jgi:16S rRNA (cytosine967-C5)-methyltransferase